MDLLEMVMNYTMMTWYVQYDAYTYFMMQENELHLLQSVWKLMRAGRLRDAALLCAHCGQSWRAAGLMGSEYSADLKLEDRQLDGTGVCDCDGDDDVDEPIQGTTLRKYWREACRAICMQCAQRTDAAARVEECVYGLLGGIYPEGCNICPSLYDAMWSMLKLSRDNRIATVCIVSPPPPSSSLGVGV